MPESEAVMTGKGCEQITSEGYLGEDRSQALRYRDCCSDEILGIGLRWVSGCCSNWHPDVVSARLTSQGLVLGN